MHEGRLTEKIMPRKNKAVMQAERIANELHNQMYGNTSAEAPVEESKAEVKQQAKVEDVASVQTQAPAPVEEVKQEVVEQKNETQPEPEVQKSEDFEHKYKVLQNKYSAEVPRLASELRGLKEELSTLRSENETLKTKPVESQPVAKKSLITDADREQYGEELLDVIKRASKEVYSENVAPTQDVKHLEQSVNDTQKDVVKLQEQKFFNELGSFCPTWQALNTEKGFLDWLGEIDPFSGQARQSILDDAFKSYDSWRVANFFNSYLQGQPKADPSSNQPDPLEQQVTPKPTGRSNSPSAKKYYTTQDVAKFYSDVRNGKYMRSQDEAKRIETDIFKAQAEGRIRATP